MLVNSWTKFSSFFKNAFYRVKEIKSFDLISENIPTKEFELKLVESERREFDY